MVGQRFTDSRIASRDEFSGGQALEVGPSTNAPYSNDRGKGPNHVHARKCNGITQGILFGGPDIVDDIDQDDENDPRSHDLHPLLAHLGRVADETKERHEEVTEEKEHTHPFPLIGLTRAVLNFTDIIPEGFFRDIGVPDQEVLGESHVSPEHGESERQHADRIPVVLIEHPLVVTPGGQVAHDQNSDGQGTPHTLGEIPDPEHGGEPVVIQSLHPEDHAQRQRNCHEGQTHRRPETTLPRPDDIAIIVLGKRTTTKTIGQ